MSQCVSLLLHKTITEQITANTKGMNTTNLGTHFCIHHPAKFYRNTMSKLHLFWKCRFDCWISQYFPSSGYLLGSIKKARPVSVSGQLTLSEKKNKKKRTADLNRIYQEEAITRPWNAVFLYAALSVSLCAVKKTRSFVPKQRSSNYILCQFHEIFIRLCLMGVQETKSPQTDSLTTEKIIICTLVCQ